MDPTETLTAEIAEQYGISLSSAATAVRRRATQIKGDPALWEDGQPTEAGAEVIRYGIARARGQFGDDQPLMDRLRFLTRRIKADNAERLDVIKALMATSIERAYIATAADVSRQRIHQMIKPKSRAKIKDTEDDTSGPDVLG